MHPTFVQIDKHKFKDTGCRKKDEKIKTSVNSC